MDNSEIRSATKADTPAIGDNEYERACKRLSDNSVGAPFVFHPDLYRKNEEPADLAWVSDSCVVLFYMSHKRKKRPAYNNEHNFSQATRWLIAWRSGAQNLRGSNAFRAFNVPFNDTRHVLIVSVIDCRGARAEYQETKRAALSVTMAATLTQGDFDAFARSGCIGMSARCWKTGRARLDFCVHNPRTGSRKGTRWPKTRRDSAYLEISGNRILRCTL